MMQRLAACHDIPWSLGALLLVAGFALGCASRDHQPDTRPPSPPPPAGVEPAVPLAPAEGTAPEAHRSALDAFDQGLYSDAVSEAERAITLDPERPEYHLMLGRALSERIHQIPVFNKLPMAHRIHAAFLLAVELDPENIEGHRALARYYSEAPPVAGGDPVKAEHHARRLLELDPVAGHRMLAKLYDLWQRPEEAEQQRQLAAEAEDETDKRGDQE